LIIDGWRSGSCHNFGAQSNAPATQHASVASLDPICHSLAPIDRSALDQSRPIPLLICPRSSVPPICSPAICLPSVGLTPNVLPSLIPPPKAPMAVSPMAAPPSAGHPWHCHPRLPHPRQCHPPKVLRRIHPNRPNRRLLRFLVDSCRRTVPVTFYVNLTHVAISLAFVEIGVHLPVLRVYLERHIP
jgi:hypothetical protein